MTAPPRARRRPRPTDRQRTRPATPANDHLVTPAVDRPAMTSFAPLPLHPALHAVLREQGLATPSPIQAATLPDAIAGRDVLGRARTGSGKTLAFGLAILTRLAGRPARPRAPRGLVLAPTRELAVQVTKALTPYATALRLRLATVVGGMPLRRQADALRAGTDIVVATPGRLNDLVRRGDCRLDQVEVSVLDEADQMADMGFLPQINALLSITPPDGQRMLFSATLDSRVDRLVRDFLSQPVHHHVDPPSNAVSTMEHHLFHLDPQDKDDALARIGSRATPVLMFVGTRHRADRLTRRLLSHGVATAALHGGKSQAQRIRTLERFRTGTVNALIATDVAARGIHIDNLDLVVNVDPPADATDYLHRAGRTARAGSHGVVVTLVLPEQRHSTRRLLATARVDAQTTHIHPDDPELARITGARTPTGVPIATAPAAPAAPARPPADPARRRDNQRGRRKPRRW